MITTTAASVNRARARATATAPGRCATRARRRRRGPRRRRASARLSRARRLPGCNCRSCAYTSAARTVSPALEERVAQRHLGRRLEKAATRQLQVGDGGVAIVALGGGWPASKATGPERGSSDAATCSVWERMNGSSFCERVTRCAAHHDGTASISPTAHKSVFPRTITPPGGDGQAAQTSASSITTGGWASGRSPTAATANTVSVASAAGQWRWARAVKISAPIKKSSATMPASAASCR